MRSKVLLAAWLLSDIIIFIGAYALAYFLRVGFIFSSDFPFDRYLLTALMTSPLWLIVMSTTRTFFLTHNQRTLRNGSYIAYAGAVGISIFTLLYYFEFTAFFSRMLLLEALIIQIALTWVWHIGYDKFRRMKLRSFPPAFPTLLVGVTRETAALIRHLDRRRSALVPVAILENKGTKEKEIEGVPVLGKLNKLEEVLKTHKITHLIQCSDLEQSINLLSACRKEGITYMLLPSVLGIVERDEHIESLEGWPVTAVHPKGSVAQRFFA